VDAFGQGGNVSVTNHGSITGGTDAIDATTTGAGTANVDNFGDLTGDVVTSGGSTITNEIGANWSLNGSNAFGGSSSLTNAGTIDSNGTSSFSGLSSLINTGTIEVQSGSLKIGSTNGISGTGSFKIDAGTTLEIASGASSGQTVTFNSTTGMLKLDNAQNFHGVVSGFSTTDGTQAHSDQIDLANINHDSLSFSESFNTANDVLTVTDGTNTANIQFTGNIGSLSFVDDGNPINGVSGTSGTIVFDPPAANSSPASAAVAYGPGPATSNTIVASVPNQTLTGGSGSNAFVFNFAGIGQDTVANFHPATDTLQFGGAIFETAQAVLNAIQDDGHGNTVVTLDAHDAITLSGVLKAQLHVSDFHFV
jgi:large repetitive protein